MKTLQIFNLENREILKILIPHVHFCVLKVPEILIINLILKYEVLLSKIS